MRICLGFCTVFDRGLIMVFHGVVLCFFDVFCVYRVSYSFVWLRCFWCCFSGDLYCWPYYRKRPFEECFIVVPVF